MDHLPYLLEFITHTNVGIQTFIMPNAFDNIKIELFPGDRFMKPTININGKINFFPIDNLINEQDFYMHARENPAIDKRYKNVNAHSLLTGSLTVGGNLGYDGHIRLTNYDPFVEDIMKQFQNGEISQAQYGYMRWQAQTATKKQLSVIGQNLSEFPPFGKSAAAQKATADAIISGKKEVKATSLKTRSSTNNMSKIFRGVVTGIVVLSAAQSIHKIVKSSDRMEVAAKEAGGWAGSLTGGELGMQSGAQIGGAVGLVFGGTGFAPGAAIGGFIGGIAGGIGGYIWGNRIMEKVISGNNKGLFKGFGNGNFGGGGANGRW